MTGRACRDTLLTRSPAPRIERDWGAQGIFTRAGNLPIGSASPGRGGGRVSGQRGSCVPSALGMSPRRGYRVGAGRAWLNGVSLSCLWLPGAKQGAFSCVQLRDDRPSPAPLGCGWPDTPGLPSSLSFPGKAWPARPWPPWASGHRASVHLCSSKRSGHYVLPTLPGPAAWHVPSVQSGPRRGAVRLLLQRPRLSSDRHCQAVPIPRVRTCSPAFHSGSRLPSEEEPCARPGQRLSLLPGPSPPGTRVRTWRRAQGSLSDRMLLMEQRMPF